MTMDRTMFFGQMNNKVNNSMVSTASNLDIAIGNSRIKTKRNDIEINYHVLLYFCTV